MARYNKLGARESNDRQKNPTPQGRANEAPEAKTEGERQEERQWWAAEQGASNDAQQGAGVREERHRSREQGAMADVA